MPDTHKQAEPLTLSLPNRRVFLQKGTLVLTGILPFWGRHLFAETPAPLRIALVTDVHYADRESRPNWNFRESAVKLAAAAEEWKKYQPDFAVELGDFIDGSKSPEADRKDLQTIHQLFRQVGKEQYYVLGNHCMSSLTKEAFLQEAGQKQSYFSFDKSGYHFVILDACFRQDGVPYGQGEVKGGDTAVSEAELEWLKADLAKTELPAIFFIHQRLDMTDTKNPDYTYYAVKNAGEVRKVLEASGKAVLVLQGHYHAGGYSEINGIVYCTLSAMITGSGEENNSFSLLEIDSGKIALSGFLKQKSYTIPKK